MCDRNKFPKNLIIEGNGFDLSLGLQSSFSNYITYKGCHAKSKFNEIEDFINKYRSYVKELSNALNNILNNFNEYPFIFIDPNNNQNHSNRILIDSRDWAEDYFAIKSVYSDYCLGYPSFLNVRNTQDYNLLVTHIRKFNTLGNRMFHSLKRMAECIYDVNFWDLLMTFQKCFSDKNIQINNWYDVENMIKYFIISVINYPNHINMNDYRLNKMHYILHDLKYYIQNVSTSSIFCFNFYTYINRYLDLLSNISTNYNVPWRNHNIINNIELQNNSTLNFRNSNNYRYYSRNLYNYVIYNNIGNVFKSLLIPDIGSNSTNDRDYYYVRPIIFLIINCLGYNPANNRSDNNNIFKFLKEQVSYFESDLCYYLNSSFINRQRYLNNSLSLQRYLANDSSFAVLDFNYTPVNSYIHNNIEHIHGSLHNRDIIIGIGDTDISNLLDRSRNNNDTFNIDMHTYKQLFSFTKTHRLSERLNNNNRNNYFNRKDIDNINNVIFFGHSLGINDYPYFQALFDDLKLYGSNVSIGFGYCKHYPNDDINHRRHTQLSRAELLLTQYGRSMSNKEHGRSIITKLDFDNRFYLRNVTPCLEKLPIVKNDNKLDSNSWSLIATSNYDYIFINVKSSPHVSRRNIIHLNNVYYTYIMYKHHLLINHQRIPNNLVHGLSNNRILESVGERIVPIRILIKKLNDLVSHIKHEYGIFGNYGISEITLEISDDNNVLRYVALMRKTYNWIITYVGPINPNGMK